MGYPFQGTTLPELQRKLAPWVKRNFGDQPAWQPLLGIVEEVGELAHAHLKQAQGIRGTSTEHDAKAKDAVGDVLIFLANYCNVRGWDLQSILDETLTEVLTRDWVANPHTAGNE